MGNTIILDAQGLNIPFLDEAARAANGYTPNGHNPHGRDITIFWHFLDRNNFDPDRHYFHFGVASGVVFEAMHTAEGVARELLDGERVLFVDMIDYWTGRATASLVLV